MLERIQWRKAPDALDIHGDELHLWLIHADEQGVDLFQGLALLGARQRKRAEGMRHQLYRERYVRAQAGLRSILSRYLRQPPESLDYSYGPAGKPYLADEERPLSFNLTTTGDLALVGISAGIGARSEIGVDCEWIRPRTDIMSIARRMFDAAAVLDLETVPEEQRLPLFYQHWTGHEADAKCDGRGLFRPRADGATEPTIAHCVPADGYVAAIARAELPPIEEWRTFDLDAV